MVIKWPNLNRFPHFLFVIACSIVHLLSPKSSSSLYMNYLFVVKNIDNKILKIKKTKY